MHDAPTCVDLGFAEEKLSPGTHICQIYSDDDERNEALLAFLIKGLEGKERSACFSRGFTLERVRSHLARRGICLDESIGAGDLSFSEAEEVYFQHGRFDPDLMLQSLMDFHSRSVQAGYPAARVIGEMLPDIAERPGGERLTEYESRVSLLLREHPITTVCQYDARAFDGATIMDVLRVHPMMVVRGNVVQNPFYVTPEEFLGK